MHRPVMPSQIAPPAAAYAHGVLVESPKRWLHTAGVVPVRPDGSVPPTTGEQAQVIWESVEAILAEVGMGRRHVVSVTTYVTAAAMDGGLADAMAARDAFLAGRLVASTLLTVPALAQPAWRLEIAIVAAS